MASIQLTNDNIFNVQGALTFETVPALMKQTEALFQGCTDATVDFSGVDECNSAGLGLMLEMIRLIQASNITIHFQSIPEQIQIVAKAYGIDEELKAQGFM